MAYFSPKMLDDDIEKINGWLEDIGATVRFETSSRNGYQYVDEYNVHADGTRNGSGVNRTISGGHAKNVSREAFEAYRDILRGIECVKAAKLQSFVGQLKVIVREGCTIEHVRALLNESEV